MATIEDRIKKSFKCSIDHTYLGGYLLQDGTNVDVKSEGIQDHRAISEVFNISSKRATAPNGWYGVLGMLKRGHIRTRPECNGFEFMKQPTQAQFDAIRNFVNYYDNGSDCYFDKMDSRGNTKYIGDFEDFVRYLQREYGEYAYY